ncbi:MAG: GLPGLI family protein [Bacteroidaceae bacterium]|nr:GLPGLI family protein [Bacteroidaceae bacterium]
MKKNLLIIALAVISSGATAQKKEASILMMSRNRLGKATVVDTSDVRIYYALNADTLSNQDTYVDLRVLEVGPKVTKCSSEFVREGEAHQKEILKTWRVSHPHADGVPRSCPIHGKRRDYWNEIQYTDIYIEGQTATEYHTMPHGFQGENGYLISQYPSQNWSLTDETITILGHKCQKATCHWRGRNFVAWFAPDIPIRRGPWLFGGLPGLILKVHDKDHHYTFEAVSIQRGNQPIIRYAYDAYRKASRDRYLRLNRELNAEYNNTIGRMGGMMKNAAGEWVPASGSKIPYEPLELE